MRVALSSQPVRTNDANYPRFLVAGAFIVFGGVKAVSGAAGLKATNQEVAFEVQFADIPQRGKHPGRHAVEENALEHLNPSQLISVIAILLANDVELPG